ncbi:DUF397 domain-containing protein [Streptomyces pactum]|uniref:DUF397 domain-containing protein n=1 Tax=Streptomyces pactum TaxID=68249 RepID=A0ABS0NLF3_9ACTN|nr:DUF397 domain-containing protein [Streptomyces pactum]MBH5336028.1 DUF397 domain-containing protein [Streptomyces pactum]
MAEFTFFKSSHSGGNAGQECVEVATNVSGIVAVRDSKDPDGLLLRFTSEAWLAFQVGIQRGEFRP